MPGCNVWRGGGAAVGMQLHQHNAPVHCAVPTCSRMGLVACAAAPLLCPASRTAVTCAHVHHQGPTSSPHAPSHFSNASSTNPNTHAHAAWQL